MEISRNLKYLAVYRGSISRDPLEILAADLLFFYHPLYSLRSFNR